MLGVTEFNILIIGRSGSGKSATTKLLTGDPSIKVANSLKEVTKEVQYHYGTSFEVNGQEVRFRILDIPGLDRLDNRSFIRERILETLQNQKISLHAIIYVSSLTERDTIDQGKLLGFLEQLPWSRQAKRAALIPVLTKYDNLVLDGHEQEVEAMKREYHEMFNRGDYGCAWSKRIYWINHTRSLQFKIKTYEEIRQKYEKQVERLIQMIRRNKHLLTAKAIQETLQQEQKYILVNLFAKMANHQLPASTQPKSHLLVLKVRIEPPSVEQSFTAVSASSIGLFISRVCKKQISAAFSYVLLGVPIAVALMQLLSESVISCGKAKIMGASGEKVMKAYERVCKDINDEMEREWREVNERLEFTTKEGLLICSFPRDRQFKFFDFSQMALYLSESPFRSGTGSDWGNFYFQMPVFQEETLWTPEIKVHYEIRKLDEDAVLKQIQILRKEFCSKI